MSRFVRPSKYRHTYSQQGRKENNYENLKVSSSAWDTDLIQANHKFLSINYQASGGGAFAILPLLSPFSNGNNTSPIPTPRLPDLIPLCRGHSAPVLDTAWDPHQPAILSSAGEDGKILIWNFSSELSDASSGLETYSGKFSGWGEEGWTCPSDFEHTASISKAGNGRKVGQVVYNPSANGILASASGDHTVRIWDTDSRGSGLDAALIELKGHRDTIQSLSWNYTGDLIITTSRDKKIRMYDPRASTSPIKETDGHGGIKGSRVVWLGDRERAVTTGFSRMSDRQMILWDTKNLVPINTETIDSSSGVIMPHYIEGNSVLLLAGKGDGNIRFFEYADDELFYLNEHKSADPQRGFTLLPRHAVDVGQNEIARGFKLTTSTVEPLGFVVPRKAENFQADIFPPAPGLEPAFSAKEWVDGKSGPPKLIDLESRATAAYQPPAQPEKKASTSDDAPVRSNSASSTPAATPASAPAPAVEYSKDTPVPSAAVIAETVKSTTEFDPRNLEIKQDDPDSDDEEMTEAKKRAPTDDDEFADEAGPSIVDVSGGKPVKEEEKSEKKVESPAAIPAATPAAVERQSTPTKDSSNDKELAAVRAELAETKKRLETLRAENAKYNASFSAMKKALAELS